MVEIDFAALRTATSLRSDCCVDDGNVLAGGNKMNGEPQRLLLPATLTEEDEFYAECSAGGIKTFVDRVNGKPVRAYPYWIDRPNCNWKAPVEQEDGDCDIDGDGDCDIDGDGDCDIDGDGDCEEFDENENEDTACGKGLMGRFSNWWKRRSVINVEFSEES